MEIVRNRASGKCFIVIDDSGNDCFMVITPEGKVKSLERRLFDTQIAFDPKDAKPSSHLTQTQMEKYAEYRE